MCSSGVSQHGAPAPIGGYLKPQLWQTSRHHSEGEVHMCSSPEGPTQTAYTLSQIAATGKTLWTTSAGSSAYDNLTLPANLPELVKQGAQAAQAASDDRVKPYRTPVTPETMVLVDWQAMRPSDTVFFRVWIPEPLLEQFRSEARPQGMRNAPRVHV